MSPPIESSTLDLPPLGSSVPARWTGSAQERRAQAEIRPSGFSVDQDVLCRWLNVAVAALAILITAPIMIVVALLVRLTSPGPVIFTQPRVGIDRRSGECPPEFQSRRRADLGGRVFTIYKFRTMRSDPRKGQVWSSRDDARVTAVGRVLRATRLDELPQLFNVLKGDMNIVGPRPEQPEIFQDLATEIRQYRDRQRVLPGITGWAQVNVGYPQTIDEVRKKVELDLEYVERRSPYTDLMIMAKTVPVMVLQKVWD